MDDKEKITETEKEITQSDKKDKKKLKIALAILGSCVVIGGGVYGICYHGESPDYIPTQKNINAANKKRDKQFQKLESENIPTVNDANKYLVHEYGSKWTNFSYNKLNKILIDKYGATNANLLLSGHCLSTSMTPYQEQQQEIELALQDKKRTDYVGVPRNQYETSIFNPTEVKESKSTYSFDSPILSNGKDLLWFSDEGYQVSAPVIVLDTIDQFIDKDTNGSQDMACLVFVQVPNKELSKDSFTDFISKMQVSLNGTNLEKFHDGLSATPIIGNMDLAKATQIFPNSIVPVLYKIPFDAVNDNTEVKDMLFTVNGHQSSLQANNSGEINFN